MQPDRGAVRQHDPQQRCKGEDLAASPDDLSSDSFTVAVLLQVTVYETLHALCQRLPREQASECDLQVKAYLPKVLQQTPGHRVSSSAGKGRGAAFAPRVMWPVLTQKPRDTCLVFGLCGPHKEELPALPQRAAAEDTATSALVSADRNHVSVWKREIKVKWNQFRL